MSPPFIPFGSLAELRSPSIRVGFATGHMLMQDLQNPPLCSWSELTGSLSHSPSPRTSARNAPSCS